MIKDGLQGNDYKIKSFLMIGQSNMAGRGDFNQVEKIDNENCYMLRMGRWQKMSEPINPDRAILEGRFHSGVCLGASFADTLSKKLDAKIGLIPCADGGTKLEQWMPGEVLFDHAVMMTELAQRTSILSGILWHQGESDCRSDEEILKYKKNLLSFICALRKRLNLEDLPFIIGELSEKITENWNFGDRPRILNGIFHEIASEINNCSVVSSNDLLLKADGIHFNSDALRIFGNRYAQAYLNLIEK